MLVLATLMAATQDVIQPHYAHPLASNTSVGLKMGHDGEEWPRWGSDVIAALPRDDDTEPLPEQGCSFRHQGGANVAALCHGIPGCSGAMEPLGRPKL